MSELRRIMATICQMCPDYMRGVGVRAEVEVHTK